MKNDINVLYVDDEPVNLLIFKTLMGKKFNVIEANNGVEGLQKVKDHPEISVIISDLQMPVMDGLEFVEKVKIIAPLTPCYIMTGYEINPKISKAIDSNLVVDYFCKPFDDKYITDELMKVVSDN